MDDRAGNGQGQDQVTEGTRIAGARRFAGNALWLLIGDAIAKVASFVFVVIVARGLGTTEYGYFNFAVSFVPLFLIVGAWGIDNIFFRELAVHRDQLSRYLMSGLVLRGGLGALATIVAFALAPLFVETTEALIALILVGVALLLDELASYVSTVFRAFEMMKFRAIRILVNRILTTSLAVLAVAFGGELLVICAMYVLGSMGALAYTLYALKRHFPPVNAGAGDAATTKALFREGAPLALGGALNMAVFRADALMLQAMKGATQVGLYGVAYRFLDSFLFVAWSLGNVALPRIARAPADQRDATFETTLALILTFYVPLAVGAYFVGDEVVEFVFGSRYRSAGAAVFWLMGAGAFYGAAYLGRMACIAVGRERAIAWIAGGALVVNLVGNAIAIPRLGFEGAALMTFVSSIVEATLIVGVFARERKGTMRVRGPWVVPLLAGGVMAVAMGVAGGDALIQGVTGSVVYGAVLVLAGRFLAPREAQVAIALIRRRGGN